jgi:type IV pilus assembly protein PilX
MSVVFCKQRHERGASLIVALIFLVVMAMLSVSLASVTTLEERMASNTRDRNLALQAAEAALRDAEVRLENAAFRAGAPGIDVTRANDAAFWEACFAGVNPPCAVKHTPTQALPTLGEGAVFEQPRFIVERKADSGTTEVYRVTARAVGGSLDTIVVLQAEMGFDP